MVSRARIRRYPWDIFTHCISSIAGIGALSSRPTCARHTGSSRAHCVKRWWKVSAISSFVEQICSILWNGLFDISQRINCNFKSSVLTQFECAGTDIGTIIVSYSGVAYGHHMSSGLWSWGSNLDVVGFGIIDGLCMLKNPTLSAS